MKDQVCKGCPNSGVCVGACNPLQWINAGSKARREPLIEDISRRRVSDRDYKNELSLLADAAAGKLERILEIEDTRIRAIAALLAVGLKKKEIAELMSMSYRQLERILKDYIDLCRAH